ncbi:lysine-specific histone demethylase 1A-like isoform X2 [Bolinopsis microptera]|uniref:lysine-specific histone demethylase 1A-like isoform X2 n=1 Tax=Bolinopsis microptera TaxID=2820187 RepID=UPI003079E74A
MESETPDNIFEDMENETPEQIFEEEILEEVSEKVTEKEVPVEAAQNETPDQVKAVVEEAAENVPSDFLSEEKHVESAVQMAAQEDAEIADEQTEITEKGDVEEAATDQDVSPSEAEVEPAEPEKEPEEQIVTEAIKCTEESEDLAEVAETGHTIETADAIVPEAVHEATEPAESLRTDETLDKTSSDEGSDKPASDVEMTELTASSDDGSVGEMLGGEGDGDMGPAEPELMEVEECVSQEEDLQNLTTIAVSINGNVVQAEVIEQGDEAVMEPGEEADEEEEQATVEENQHDETDIVTEMPETTTVPPHPRPQVFAEIIEEEIIEEETVEMINNREEKQRHQSDDIITSLDAPAPHSTTSRRLQAREDAAKRKDESMLLSTKKIIDSTDDVLRSAQALLKSTENKDGVEESAGKQPSRYPAGDIYQPQPREKRQKKKKSKPDLQKEKEIDPDYDPEDDFDDKEFLSPKDLESAAFASRLPADRMTKQEAISFSEIFNVKDSQAHFLYIRNRLLFVWLEDPKNKLTVENALPRIEPPHNEDEELVERVYEYLNRYGFINFGVYASPKLPEPSSTAPKVLVVGAGISGLTAARQLQEFGINVDVIEARSVVGGRVCTFKDGNYVADLGAMVVTGLGGNPLAVLAKQLNLELMPIKQDCPLYEFTGQMVPKERDERVEREFNRLLEATTYMSHQLNVNSINGRPVSLGQALEIIIKLQIRQVKEKQLKHGRERCEIQEKLNHIQQALFPLHEKIKDSHSKYLELKMKHEELSDQLGEVIRDQKAEFEVKAAYKVMLETFAEYDALLKEQQELEVQLTKMEQMVPNEIYMTPQERHVLDWHCANLEFANAAPLSALSLKHWDQDDDFEFTGNHLVVHDGMSTITEAMSKGLNIRHNTACVGIKYTDSGVEVATREVNQVNSSWATNTTNTITADAVLLTIPLGVLKKEKLKFDPPLPEWKTSAIKRMGFGNLNKVVLCFNKVFWDPSIHLFGHVSNSTISRGELFLFWSVSKAPVLIALIAGEAATVIETVPDEAIVGRAMTILRAIFGFQTVPQPSKHRVTRWRGDPWALGSYSYVAAGSSGSDYDDLARPVAPQNASGAHPRLFFAGEHTIRNYPATVHGALLSGLREAGRISDQFLGPPYSKDTTVNVTTPAQ